MLKEIHTHTHHLCVAPAVEVTPSMKFPKLRHFVQANVSGGVLRVTKQVWCEVVLEVGWFFSERDMQRELKEKEKITLKN